ncbi:hypothetical protein Q5P01_024387 [Channa striata]|uniref:Cyclin-I n=1 Tax=Channa striata TaxID=64152 RepID=A0AA88IQA1_CHASR|nr:hypothetical protein Q5P01_024387 [Channa striata]
MKSNCGFVCFAGEVAVSSGEAASREATMWKVYVPKKPPSQDTDISPAQRDEAVRWLTELHSRLQLYPETLVLAVSILDRFLAPIKARPKYLRCIAIACFFLAAKMLCSLSEGARCIQQLWLLSSEILRMERIILDKLNWDLHTATALDFLHIFHAMVMLCRSGLMDSMLGLNRSQHLALLTQRLYYCLADHTLVQLRGSMLALALITLELESCCPDWLALTIELLRKAKIDSSELIRSRELRQTTLQPPAQDCCMLGTIASIKESSRDHGFIITSPAPPPTPAEEKEEGSQLPLSTASSSTDSSIPALLSPAKHVHPLNHLQRVTLRCKASAKRKVEEMEVDDFYDGIKRLYNEEVTTTITIQEGATSAMGAITAGGEDGGEGGLSFCGVLLSRQEGSTSPCPPLQPASTS